MAERYMPFDYQETDPREYASSLWALMQRQLSRDGVVVGVDNELQVVESDPPAMTVDVGTGAAFVRGRFYANEDVAKELTVPTADATNPRIDRIVVRLDLSTDERTILAVLKEGTPAVDPDPPTLQRDATIWEVSLAQILVGAGVTSITNLDISDERGQLDVGGWSVHPASTAIELASIMLQS